jgi:hypothetical protein
MEDRKSLIAFIGSKTPNLGIFSSIAPNDLGILGFVWK